MGVRQGWELGREGSKEGRRGKLFAHEEKGVDGGKGGFGGAGGIEGLLQALPLICGVTSVESPCPLLCLYFPPLHLL